MFRIFFFLALASASPPSTPPPLSPPSTPTPPLPPSPWLPPSTPPPLSPPLSPLSPPPLPSAPPPPASVLDEVQTNRTYIVAVLSISVALLIVTLASFLYIRAASNALVELKESVDRIRDRAYGAVRVTEEIRERADVARESVAKGLGAVRARVDTATSAKAAPAAAPAKAVPAKAPAAAPAVPAPAPAPATVATIPGKVAAKTTGAVRSLGNSIRTKLNEPPTKS